MGRYGPGTRVVVQVQWQRLVGWRHHSGHLRYLYGQLNRRPRRCILNAHGPVTPQERRGALDAGHRGRQADLSRIAAARRRQALQAQRQVCAALGAGHRVDLVDYHQLDGPPIFANLRAQHEIERRRRGHQHVVRVCDHPLAFALRRVARTDIDLDRLRRITPSLRRALQADQRRPEVALHVVKQRREGRDVHHGEARTFFWLAAEPVERPEECGQGLVAAGGRDHQRVVARGDRWPAQQLDLSGLRNVSENHARVAGEKSWGTPFPASDGDTRSVYWRRR